MSTTRRGKAAQPATLRVKPCTPAVSPWRFALAALALCALVLIAYGNSVGNGFVWDDHEQIVMNPYMKPGAPILPLWTADVRFAHQGPSVQTQVYRPLQLITYRCVVDWFGGAPDPFHSVSLGFAAAGAVAAFAVFWLLTRTLGLSFAAAALFAVHPVHTEAVDWIAALPDLGCGLFLLLAFALFLLGLRRTAKQAPGSSAWLFRCLSLIAFLLAMLWKETAVVFPLLVLSYVAILQRSDGQQGSSGSRRAGRALVQSAPYWVVLAAYLALRLVVLGSLTAGPRTWSLHPAQFVLTALHLLLLYGGKLLVPIGLNAYAVFHPVRSIADARAAGSVAPAIAAAVGVFFLIRRAPLAGFAALWVCITLLPALNLNGLGRNVFAERYLYLPSAGFCLLALLAAEWVANRIPEAYRRPASGGLLAAALVACTVEILGRNPIWKDDNTLFGETLTSSPDAAFVRNMVAAGQSADAAQWNAAVQNYQQASALAQGDVPPDRLDEVAADKGLASLYADRGQYDRALQTLAQARQMEPGSTDDPDLAGEEGMILARAGRGGEAETLLDRALAEEPNNENVLSALGLIARDEHHDLGRAAELFSRALAVHPQEDDFSASQHNNLGAVYADQDNFAGAVSELKHAVAVAPNDPEYHVNLASALAGEGRYAEARTEAQMALQMAPGDPNATEILQRLDHQP